MLMRKAVALIVFGGILFLNVFCATKVSVGIEEQGSPSWAPDGKHLVFECYIEGPTEGIAESNSLHYTIEAADICTIEVNGRNQVHLTKDPGQDRYPVWGPDGSKIAYTRSNGVYTIGPDGGNQQWLVKHSDALEAIGRVIWMPSGSQLLFAAQMESSKQDIYLVDVNSGTLTNLTSANQTHDFAPTWALDGSKIVFLASTYTNPSLGQVPARLKVINTDGSNERVIYNEEIYYNFVSVTKSGRIIFATFSLADDGLEHLYTINLNGENGPTEIAAANRWLRLSVSPDGQYLAYGDLQLHLLDLETETVRKLPPPPNFHLEDVPSWSPDSQQIAVTGSENTTGFYEEKHINIFDLQNNTVRPLFQ